MGFPAVDHYRHMGEQLGVAEHTTFTGKIPYVNARDYLALGDLAVAPKLSATEGSGKILNYMAMGLPTVAFATPVSKEYLEDDGIYAPPGDARALAMAIVHGLANTAEQRQKVGMRLRNRAETRFSWDQAAQTILRAYGLVCHVEPTVI
jgi:glycosyltransferase involved in cell wall biosynthesis